MAITLGLVLLFWIAAALLVRSAFGKAPLAFEDDAGFHRVPEMDEAVDAPRRADVWRTPAGVPRAS